MSCVGNLIIKISDNRKTKNCDQHSKNDNNSTNKEVGISMKYFILNSWHSNGTDDSNG